MSAYFPLDPVNGLNWHKSQHCGSDTCVEAAAGAGVVLVRDSSIPDGDLLAYEKRNWQAFIRGLEEGLFDRR